MSAADDVVTLIRELAPSDLDVFTMQEFEVKKKLQGTMVEQRQTTTVPDLGTHTETVYLNVLTYGEGGGGLDAGRARARSFERSEQIYRALYAIYDRTINGNFYIRISPDSAPVEIPSQVGTYDFQFGLEAVRFVEGLTWQ